MPDTKEPTAQEGTLEPCWHDQRELDFNVEIHHILQEAGDAMDTSNEPGPEGPLAAITRALHVIEEIRSKLIAEAAFRGATVTPSAADGLAASRATMKVIAARIAAALDCRERGESCVITSTLAIEQLSSDYTRNIAQTLQGTAWDEIWNVHEHLQAAMQLIPEADRPESFELDSCIEAPALDAPEAP